jgi:hypothetical protein
MSPPLSAWPPFGKKKLGRLLKRDLDIQIEDTLRCRRKMPR